MKFHFILELKERRPNVKFTKKSFFDLSEDVGFKYMCFSDNELCFVFENNVCRKKKISIAFIESDDFEVLDYE